MPATTTTVNAAAQSNAGFGGQSSQGSWFFDLVNHRNHPYGMPLSFIVGLHTNPSTFSKSLNAIRPPFFRPGVSIHGSNPQQSLTNASLMALRQQMEESNH